MRKSISWTALTVLACFLLIGPVLAQEARDLYLSHGGKPGVKLSIELVRHGKTLMVPPEHIFHSGDRIRLHFETNFDGHVAILGKGSSGRVTLLFPYPGAVSEIEKGGVKLMPAKDDWLVFDDQPGEEQLAIILSRKPIAELAGTGAATPTGGSGSTGGPASPEEEEEILAALNSRALKAGRGLFHQQSSDDAGYAVTAREDVLDEPVGLLVTLTHEES